MLSTCIKHPDRIVEIAVCSTILRDGLPPQLCECCDECRAKCLRTPHGHGGKSSEEWENGYCKICGMDITRFLDGNFDLD